MAALGTNIADIGQESADYKGPPASVKRGTLRVVSQLEVDELARVEALKVTQSVQQIGVVPVGATSPMGVAATTANSPLMEREHAEMMEFLCNGQSAFHVAKLICAASTPDITTIMQFAGVGALPHHCQAHEKLDVALSADTGSFRTVDPSQVAG